MSNSLCSKSSGILSSLKSRMGRSPVPIGNCYLSKERTWLPLFGRGRLDGLRSSLDGNILFPELDTRTMLSEQCLTEGDAI
jgi:hypothetical protein